MVARTLEREGVEHIFALRGGHVDPMFQACFDRDIRIIDTRHEQAAGHMAGARARTTGTARGSHRNGRRQRVHGQQ